MTPTPPTPPARASRPPRKPLAVVRELPRSEESAVVRALDEIDERHDERHRELVSALHGNREELAVQRTADRRAQLAIVGAAMTGALVLALVAVLSLADTRGVDVAEVVDGAARLTPKVGTDLLDEVGESPTEEAPEVAPAPIDMDSPSPVASPPVEHDEPQGRFPSLTPAAAAAEPARDGEG